LLNVGTTSGTVAAGNDSRFGSGGGSLPVVAFNPNTATSLTCPGTSGAQFVASTTLTGAASIPTVSCTPATNTAVQVQIVLTQGATVYGLTLPSPFAVCDFTQMAAADTMTESGTFDGTNYVDTSCTLKSGTGTVVTALSPGVGIAHFAGSTQTVTSSAVNLAGGSNEVTGLLPTGNIATAQVTRTATVSDLAPVAGDDGLILALNPATAIHLTRISCGVQGTTSVVVNLVKGGASLIADMTATAGDANTVVVTTWANGSSQCGGTSNCAVAAHTPVTMHIGTISGTPTALNCSIDYTVD
jgi:hypothetical protein